MHSRFPSETTNEYEDNQMQQPHGEFLNMMYGENEEVNFQTGFTKTQTTEDDTFQEK